MSAPYPPLDSSHYALFGAQIDLSLSPTLYAYLAAQAGVTLPYTRYSVTPHQFAERFDAFASQGGRGANITSPLKTLAYRSATRHSQRAQRSQAVNLLLRLDTGDWFGDHCDGAGFIRALDEMLVHTRCPKYQPTILFLGAGGVALNLIDALSDYFFEPVILLSNRTQAAADALKARVAELDLPVKLSTHRLEAAYPQSVKADLIIHAANLQSPLPAILRESWHPNTLAVDLHYATNTTTPFLAALAQQGVGHCQDGLGMLIHQGRIAFQAWTGHTASSNRSLLHALRRASEER